MKKELMIALRSCYAWSFEGHAETSAWKWAEQHGINDWGFVKELREALELRRRELHEQETHQARRHQWVAHTLCGRKYVKDFKTAIRAAVRLFQAYDDPVWDDDLTEEVRSFDPENEPSDEVLGELTRIADYLGQVRLARILRAGSYTEELADRIQKKLSQTRRKRY